MVGSQEGRNTREGENVEKGDKRKDQTKNSKGYEGSASLRSTFPTLAAAQIYRLFILHQVSAPNGKKKNHIQVSDKRHTTGDMTSE